MKSLNSILLYILILVLASCKPKTDYNKLIFGIQACIDSGSFSKAEMLADSLRKNCAENGFALRKADSLLEIGDRIRIDFSLDESQIMSKLESRIAGASVNTREEWERKGWLEYRMIDNEKKYFNRAASNLVLIKNFYENKGKALQKGTVDPEIAFRLKHDGEVIEASTESNMPVKPLNMKISYSLTVNADAVPEGEIVRCWLPWPRSDNERQKRVQLISTSEQEYLISPDSSLHSTVYMEKKAEKGKPVVFTMALSYQSSARYFNPEKINILPYDKSSELYKKYTAEQLPQICFTENVKKLADSIAAGEENPVISARKIYMWFKENIPWAGALEYSIMPNIPEYVIKNRRGDCGMQTFLFMSMLRYKGIPVKWQSGWMVPPDAENLHDWCEIYYEGIGWVPADVSYELLPSDNKELREFYFSGIDAYRMIINEGISGRLYPEKQHLRSEPYDFQRGEVEWKGGNLYFDKWDYFINIEYVK
jgi:transglutaminase-like putative cysteine protease